MLRRLLTGLILAVLAAAGCDREGKGTDGPESADLVAGLPGGGAMEFVWIEPGNLRMGSPLSDSLRSPDEGPEHRVAITRGFYLGRYEITQGQWVKVMGTAPWEGHRLVRSDPRHPAVNITWYEVQEFIRRLNAAAGEEVYRLPTEAEWEHACRAGTATAWSFGDDREQLDEHAWYHDNAWDTGRGHPREVGTRRPNPWGLYDMHGNAMEWCQDRAAPYAAADRVDPTGAAAGLNRVIRGGDFGSDARYVRSAFRCNHPPDARGYGLGARLARSR